MLLVLPMIVVMGFFAQVISNTHIDNGSLNINVKQAAHELKEDGKVVWSKVVQK